MKEQSVIPDADLATPGYGAIELADIKSNDTQNNVAIELADIRSNDTQNNLEAKDSFSEEESGQSIVNMNFDQEFSASVEAGFQVYEKPNTTYVTPMDGTTGGGLAGENTFEEPTPGGSADQWLDDFREFGDLDGDIDKIQNKNDIGDCYYCWKHKKCFCFFGIFLLLLLFTCLILLPKPLHLCVTFSFDDKNAIDKVPGDEGHFELTIKNPNYIPVSVQGFEISAYYGGVAEKKRVINVARSDYSIGSKTTLRSNNKTYVYAENSPGIVPFAALNGCSMGARAGLTYDLVASFKGCLMPFLCKSGIVLETPYINNCQRDHDWMCTEFEILG